MGLAPEKASRINDRDTQTTGPDPWSIGHLRGSFALPMDLGSVYYCQRILDKPGGKRLILRKKFMRRGSESIKILINHWRWLQANGYKQQAASCKQQAASLTRKNYNVIGIYNSKQKG